MDATSLLVFLRQHRLAVQASVSSDGAAQAAVIGVAFTDRFEAVFDTVDTTRKARNLRKNPNVALVIGGFAPGDDERTVQYDGVADEPEGLELERIKHAYYLAYPDGPSRLRWPGLIYMRVRPRWIRYSDYTVDPPQIVEFTPDQLMLREPEARSPKPEARSPKPRARSLNPEAPIE